MSSDFLNPIGASVPRLNQTSSVAPARTVQAPSQTQTETGSRALQEGFNPSTEARESLSDLKAGEAKASEILGAWGLPQSSPGVSTGQLSVQGASNTTVNQAHAVNNGVYQPASGGAESGFSAATVYSSRPPQG